MKKLTSIILTASILFSLSACNVAEKVNNKTVKIEDIEWNVNESVVDGQRYLVLEYTNNSECTIVDVEMKFTLKDSLTTEQLSALNSAKEKYKWSDDKLSEVYILGYNRKIVEPQETSKGSACVFNGTYQIVENIEQYNLMEPDMVQIAYMKSDDKVYSLYYDFKNQEYTEDETGGIAAVDWSDSEIAKLISKPDVKVLKVSSDKEDKFSFSAFGVSNDIFTKYVDDCKNKEFTDVGFESTNGYRASNSAGYEVDVKYNANEETMNVTIEK